MRVELILYLYGIVCVSMILFNIAYALILRGSEPRMERRRRRLGQQVELQLEQLRQGRELTPGHLNYLERTLRRSRNLAVFDQVLRPLVQDGSAPWVHAYLAQLQPVILSLALVYKKRETTQAAFFSYFLSRYMIQSHLPIQTLQAVLLDFLRRENLYCRVNALQALCSFGSEEYILAALHVQDGGEVFLHEKILTEGLLSYTGDHTSLIRLLWEHLGSFSPRTRLAIVNYIRFRSGSYSDQMMALMQDETEDKEVRLSAIRYFGRYPNPSALGSLLSFARDEDPIRWEYATVSVSSLAAYREPEVLETLKGALHSPNWYVRYGAASSLEAQGVTYEDLMDIVTGDDRYAREMVLYRLEARQLQNAGR